MLLTPSQTGYRTQIHAVRQWLIMAVWHAAVTAMAPLSPCQDDGGYTYLAAPDLDTSLVYLPQNHAMCYTIQL